MWKYILLALTSAAAAFCSKSQRPAFTLSDSIATLGCGPNSREIVKRNGIIKTLVSRTVIKDGKKSIHPAFTAYYYDESGKLVKQEMLSKEGVAGTIDTMIYDSGGKLLRMLMIDKNGKVHYEWNLLAGLAVTKMSLNGALTTDTSILDYDGQGRLHKISYIRDSLNYTDVYHYDLKNRFKRIERLDKNGHILYTHIFNYSANKKGSVTEITARFPHSSERTTKCWYNDLGQATRTTQYVKNGIAVQEKFSYNTDGSLAKQVSDFSNKTRIIYEYKHIYSAKQEHP